LGQAGTARAFAKGSGTVAELARFFPEATPVRIAVQFTRRANTGNESQPGGEGVAESTVIEFGTSREVLFGGWPSFHDCCVRHSDRGCPILAFFARVAAMLHRYLIGYDATWINNLRLHFRLPPFAKNAKDGAPIFLLMTGRSKAWATRQKALRPGTRIEAARADVGRRGQADSRSASR
jgi:hypothetical protein